MTAHLEQAYDFAGAARRLTDLGFDVSERWLREHIGQVPHTKVGRNVRFTDSLLAEFLEQQTRRPVERPRGPIPPTSRRRSA